MSTEIAERQATDVAATVEPEEFDNPRFRVVPGTDAHELQVLMPGVTRDGVTISLDGDQLGVVGRRRQRVPAGWRPRFREHEERDYRLRVRLNIRIDEEKIHARMEDGVLYLTLPIHGEAKPRQIQVS
jgi:HSP20 family protein